MQNVSSLAFIGIDLTVGTAHFQNVAPVAEHHYS